MRWWTSFTTQRGWFHLPLQQLARRLGGLGAAALALWWLKEGSNIGLHFDQAFIVFMVLCGLSAHHPLNS